MPPKCVTYLGRVVAWSAAHLVGRRTISPAPPEGVAALQPRLTSENGVRPLLISGPRSSMKRRRFLADGRDVSLSLKCAPKEDGAFFFLTVSSNLL